MGVPKATGTRRLSIPLLLSSSIVPLLLLFASCAPGRAVKPTDVPTNASRTPAPGTTLHVPDAVAATPDAGSTAPETAADVAQETPAVDVDAPGEDSEAAIEVAAGENVTEVVEDEVQAPAPHDDLAVNPPAPTPGEIERERAIASQQAPTFDIPMVVNEKVTAWVDFYSGRHKEKFRTSLVRSGKYLPMIQSVFEAAGIPKDLAYLAHVESAFKSRAYSKAKAKGMFQFIAGTGKRYGLRMDNWIDERSDPEKSARACAAYLVDLHDEFGDWYLAMAAYNAGEGKIRRAIRSTGSKDFWTIAKSSAIRNETKNYVPAILAATLIAKDSSRYGLDYVPDAPLAYDIAEVRGSFDLVQLARTAGLDPESLRDLNPELRRGRTPPGRTTSLKVPIGTGSQTVAALGKIPAASQVVADRHVVRKGETLGVIAKKHGVSVASIQRANKMGKSTTLRVGRALAIPGLTTTGTASEAVAHADSEPKRSVVQTKYRVRKGDTLSSIARRHGCTPAAIATASGISVNGTIHAGQTLAIPRKNTASAKVASATESAPAVHTVRSGETLWIIAARYRTSVDRLCDLNEMTQSEPLYPGRRLTVR